MCFSKPKIYGVRWCKVMENGYSNILFEYKSSEIIRKGDLSTISEELKILSNKKINSYDFYIYQEYCKKRIKCFIFSKKDFFLKWKKVSYDELRKIINI